MGLWIPKYKPVRGTRLNKSHPLAKNLAGAWLLNEYSGNIATDLVNNFTLTSTLSWAGSGILADGTNRLTMAHNGLLMPSSAISIAALIYDPGSIAIAGSICGKVSSAWSYHLYFGAGSEQLAFRINSTTAYYPTASAPGGLDFMHGVRTLVVGTYDKANVKCYARGILGTTEALSDSITSDSGNFSIFTRGDTVIPLNAGIIEALFLWSERALTYDEVRSLNTNPYGMFERPSRAKYFYVAAGGETYTASGSNRYQGAISRMFSITRSQAGSI